jgi:hypothetical protein
MKSLFVIAAILLQFNLSAFADNIEQTLAKKGHAVVCAQSTGVLNVETLHSELNTKISNLKEKVVVSQPSVSMALINVSDKNTSEPGALSVVCVTVSKAK